MQRTENYMVLEFLSRSSNEGFARSAVAAFAAQLDPTLDESVRQALRLHYGMSDAHVRKEELKDLQQTLRS